MPSLREVQIAFCAAIRSEDAGAMADWVLDAGIPPERRIQIYRNNYRIGALAVMQKAYPVVERLSGADWFEQSVAKFQQMHPSQSGDLQHLGANYPSFLRGELADTLHGYFSDVAALEWCYQLVLTAQERGPVDVALLHAVAPEDYEGLKFVRARRWAWSSRNSRSSRSGRPTSHTRRAMRQYASTRPKPCAVDPTRRACRIARTQGGQLRAVATIPAGHAAQRRRDGCGGAEPGVRSDRLPAGASGTRGHCGHHGARADGNS